MTALDKLIDAVEAGELPDPCSLKILLRYQPETGALYWNERPGVLFKRDRDCVAWNARYANREAFTTTVKGYRSGNIFNRSVYAHRVILAMTDGIWPQVVDHINGDKQDNRIANLRSVTHAENMRNLPVTSANSSGYIGVWYVLKRSKWGAQIVRDGRNIFLGHYDNEREANIARRAAEKALSFHENHGLRAYRSVQA